MSRLSSSAAGWPLRRLETTLVGLGLAAAALLGPAIYYLGAEVFAWLALPFGSILLLVRPEIGLLAMAGTLPVENLGMFGSVTATRLLGIAVFAVWLTRKFGRRESWQAVFSTSFFRLCALLAGLFFLSVLWAVYPSDVIPASFQLVRMLLWSLLVIDLVTSWDRAVWLARAMVIGGMLTSILVIQQYSRIQQQSLLLGEVIEANRAGANIAGGLNYTAAILTTILPLAFFVVRDREYKLWRALAVLCVPLAIAAIALTQSRLSYAMLALVILIEYRESIKKRAGRSWAVTGVVVALGIAAAIMLAPHELVLGRFQHLTQDLYGERIFLYKVAVAIFWDHPLLGAGADNFRTLFGDYQYLVSGASQIWGGPRSPHSSYSGLLADLGVGGLLLWLAILGTAWRSLGCAQSRLGSSASSRHLLLVKAVAYSLLLQTAYGLGSVVYKDKMIWLLVGLGVAIGQVAVETTTERLDSSLDRTLSETAS